MVVPTKTWKQFEARCAGWFGTKRNPLSGANNRGDQGQPRPGDVIYEHALIECKHRASNATITRAKNTQKEAKALGKPWIHIEGARSQRLYCFVVDEDTAELLVRTLKKKYEGKLRKF